MEDPYRQAAVTFEFAREVPLRRALEKREGWRLGIREERGLEETPIHPQLTLRDSRFKTLNISSSSSSFSLMIS